MSKSKTEHNQVMEELTNYIEGLIHQREDTIGLSIALVFDSEVIWAEGFGYTDHSRKEPVTANTLFSIQSMGKSFTSTAFMIMASKELISLDDNIQKFYPKFTINTNFGDIKEEIAKITFRRMLSHRAGFTHETLVGNNYDYSPCTFEEHIMSISKGWLKSPVGSELSYSNLGYDLVAYIMGLIHNKTFPEVMTDELFKPLKLTSATYDINEALKKPFAKGFDGDYVYPQVQIPMLGAGGLFISVSDVAKFISFHLNKGKIGNKQLIHPDLFEEMYKPQFYPTKEFGYGLGLYAVEKIDNEKVYGHAGGGYGYQTNMIWLPDHKLGVVVLSNNMKESRVGSIAKKALELMVSNLRKLEAKSLTPKLLKRLEGTYCANGNLAPQILRIVYEKKALFLYTMDGSQVELLPQKATEFLTQEGIRYTFELTADGKPNLFYVDNIAFPYKAKFNIGPNDEYGPNQLEWQEYLGIYLFEDESRPNYLALGLDNGYLYLVFRGKLKLHHHKNNLFFTVDGEALTLKNSELNYRGIPAKKIDFKPTQFLKEFTQQENRFDYYYMAILSLVRILYTLQEFKQVLDFIEKIIIVDKKFTSILVKFGKELIALGKENDAKSYFTKMLECDPENIDIEELLSKLEK
ncbi:MAG: serine hydrolase [Asgard group archaeon]|nr:serine hydrolase [Asgard group archaeon]